MIPRERLVLALLGLSALPRVSLAAQGEPAASEPSATTREPSPTLAAATQATGPTSDPATPPPGEPNAPSAPGAYPAGVAGAPTPAGRRVVASLEPLGVDVLAGVDLAGSYVYRRQRAQAADGASDWFHVFELTRGHLALGAESSHAEGRLLVETVRSAADGSLTGVAGDSLVLRAREAFVGLSTCGRRRPAEPNLDLAPCLRTVRGRASLGVVPTPLLAELDGTAMMGPLSRSTGERESWLSPSDAGVSARLDFGAAAHVTGGVFNGEGYGQRELNRGKNGEVVLVGRPLSPLGLAPFALVGAAAVGSEGVGLARANRWTGAAVWQGSSLRAGVAFTQASGILGDGAREARAFELFSRGELPLGFTVGGRVAHVQRNIAATGDALSTVVVFVGHRPAPLFEVDLVFDHQLPASITRSIVQGVDRTEVRLVGRFVL